MNTDEIPPQPEMIEANGNKLPDLLIIYEYPELENYFATGGSSQVLGDIFEFTDYLIPVSAKARHMISEDYYSALLSI